MLEVVRFLADHPPFAGLDEGALARIAGTTKVEFFPKGTTVLRQGGGPSAFLYVVRRGAVELVDSGRVVDVLDEGEVFGFASLLTGDPPALTAMVAEDALCYLYDRSVIAAVVGSSSVVDFLARSLGRQPPPGGDDAVGVAVPVASIAHSPLIVVTPDTPVAVVAERMSDAGVTAVIVSHDGGTGIVTDVDLRRQVVAGRRTGDTPVGEIMTTPARTVPGQTLAEEAMIELLDHGIHHLAIVEGGEVVGMLTDLDLLRLERRDAFRLRSEIARAPDAAAAAAAGRGISGAAATLVASGTDPPNVGRTVAALTDALVRRLLELTFAERGEPPVSWCWLAMGSAGRREQGLVTDQDHALVYADGGEEHDDYFAAVAGEVARWMETAGIARCPSKVMANEDGWRGSESWWRRRLADWMTVPERGATFLTGLAFDARPVAGSLDVAPIFTAATAEAPRHPGFLQRLGRLACELRVPLGFVGNLVVADIDSHVGVLDIKAGGLLPITELARVAALGAGAHEVSTMGRLRHAAGNTLAEAEAGALEEAFAAFSELRLVHQGRQWSAGAVPDNLIDPDDLGTLERRRLKDAFRIVRHAQAGLRERLAPRLLGR